MQQLRHDRGTPVLAERPSCDKLVARVRDLAPGFAAVAQQTELDKRVPAKSMTLMREAGLFNLLKPAAFGGFEYGPAEAAQIGIEIGRACGSTGWCGTLAIYYHLLLSYFPLQTQQEVYGSANELIAVSYMPGRGCEPIDGGYRISGTWPYASNCDNAGWLMVAVLAPSSGGAPVLCWMLAPAEQFAIDQQSWNVAGLQGTGSKTVSIADPVFVPHHRVVKFADVLAGEVPGAAIEGNVQARYRFPTFGPTCLVAPILGMAQGALDSFIENARSRVRQAKPGVINPVAASPMLQSRIGQNSAAIDGAKALLVGSLEGAAQKVRGGRQPDQSERIAIRRNQAYAADTAVRVVNDLFNHNGTAGAGTGAPLQRFWRDANAAALHASLDWEAVSTMYGQHELGIEPLGSF